MLLGRQQHECSPELTVWRCLQTSKRTGWVRCNVKGPESIADHMYRMGMMSLIAGSAGVSMDRCHSVPCQHSPGMAALCLPWTGP